MHVNVYTEAIAIIRFMQKDAQCERQPAMCGDKVQQKKINK